MILPNSLRHAELKGLTPNLVSFARSEQQITDFLMNIKAGPAQGDARGLLVITGKARSGKTSSVLSYTQKLSDFREPHLLAGHDIQTLNIEDFIKGVLRADTLPSDLSQQRKNILLRAFKDLIDQAHQSSNHTLFVTDFDRLLDLAKSDAYREFATQSIWDLNELRKKRGLIVEVSGELSLQRSANAANSPPPEGWPLRIEEGVFQPKSSEYRVTQLEIPELSAEEARRVLMKIRGEIELRNGAQIHESAIDKALEISQKLRNPNLSLLQQSTHLIERGAWILSNGMDNIMQQLAELQSKIDEIQRSIDDLNQPQVINGEFKHNRLKALDQEQRIYLQHHQALAEKIPPLRQHFESLATHRNTIIKNERRIRELNSDLPQVDKTTQATRQSEINRLKTEIDQARAAAQEDEKALEGLGSFVRLEVDAGAVVAGYARSSGQKIESAEKLLSGNLSDYFSPDLFDRLRKKLIGQTHIVKNLEEGLKPAISGNRLNSMKPLFSGLFLGPPGTGKTELAKMIALDLHLQASSLGKVARGNLDDPHTWGSYAEFNAAEFLKPEDLSKFIGSSPGFVGYGQLPRHLEVLEKAQGRPVVFLVDEIEKAHPALTEFLLKWLNGEPIVSGDGKIFPSNNIIFIFTSNAITDAGSFKNQSEIVDFLKSGQWINVSHKENPFVPAFLSRVEPSIFSEFSKENLVEMVRAFHTKDLTRLIPQKIHYRIDLKLIEILAEMSLGPTNGARQLHRNYNTFIAGALDQAVQRGWIRKNEGRSYNIRLENKVEGKEYAYLINHKGAEYGIFVEEKIQQVGQNGAP